MDGKGVCDAYSMPKKVGVTMLTSDDLIFKRKLQNYMKKLTEL